MSAGGRQTLVVVDEDTHSLREIEAIASRWFRVVATRMPGRALGAVKEDPSVSVIVADHNLTSVSGISVLQAAAAIRPATRRLLLAPPSQLADVIGGVHCGAVERIIYKPVSAAELSAALFVQTQNNQRKTA